MDRKQNPEGASPGHIEAEDDVEGHRIPHRVNPDEIGNDVSGHAAPRNPAEVAANEDDVEGHQRNGALPTDVDGRDLRKS